MGARKNNREKKIRVKVFNSFGLQQYHQEERMVIWKIIFFKTAPFENVTTAYTIFGNKYWKHSQDICEKPFCGLLLPIY
jgi:hypothetical protein